MKILVTGASGFLGRNYLLSTSDTNEVFATYNQSKDFLEFLENNKLHWIKPVRVDLSQKDELKRVFSENTYFDLCIYFAANGNPALSVQNVSFDLLSNTLSLVNLFEIVSIKRIVFFSSGAVYDGIQGEVSFAKTKQLNPHLPYAISKISSELYVNFFYKQRKIESFAIVRFFGAYGAFEPERKIYTKLVKRFGFEKKSSFTIIGNGMNYIDAMHIDDAIRAIQLIEKSDECLELDLYSGQRMTVNNLVKTVGNLFGFNPVIQTEGNVPEFIEFYSIDDTMKKKFGFEPRISLHDGIHKLFQFLKSL